MGGKIIFIIILGILLVGAGGRLIYYGAKAGVIDEKILVNKRSNMYATGKKAIMWGWCYVVAGVITIASYVLYLVVVVKILK